MQISHVLYCTQHPEFPYIIFANIRMKQNNKIECAVVASVIRCQNLITISVNLLDGCIPSQMQRSADLLSYWFQIFLICGNLIDCIRGRYECLFIITCFFASWQLFRRKNNEISKRLAYINVLLDCYRK